MPSPILINGDSLRLPLPDASVHTILTSPPYYMLREYAAANQLGQELIFDCNAWAFKDRLNRQLKSKAPNAWATRPPTPSHLAMLQEMARPCGRCFICQMRVAFAEAWRVLRPDGTLWLNIGDTSASRGGNRKPHPSNFHRRETIEIDQHREPQIAKKQWYGIPWRLALALQADGWLWRMDIVWQKENGLPEPVKDRPSRSHEYIWLFSKQRKYYYDWFAVQEVAKVSADSKDYQGSMRRQRSVWSMPVSNYGGGHFATYPAELAETVLKAAAPAAGVCAQCGRPAQRDVKKVGHRQHPENPNPVTESKASTSTNGAGDASTLHNISEYKSFGWHLYCDCIAPKLVPAKVLDPFAGSGTTLEVARKMGLQGIGVDISHEYLVREAKERLGLAAVERFYQAIPGGDAPVDFGLFAGR